LSSCQSHFDEVVFKPHGTTNQDAISTFIDHLLPTHCYDNVALRKELWENYRIGSFAVKEVGCMWDTVTNLCCDATSKSHLFLFPIITLFCTPPHSIISRGHFLHVDPTFAALNVTVKHISHKPYSPVEYEPGLKDSCCLSSFACLTNSRHKAKALLPILAISCLLLNLSTCSVDKHLLQTVFGTIYFFKPLQAHVDSNSYPHISA
jgi:hypothetical protein